MNRRNFLRISLFITLSLALAIMIPLTVSQAQNEPEFPEELKEKIKYYSGMHMLIAAQEFDVPEIMGKDITIPSSPPGRARAKKLRDVGIGMHADNHENEPTVVANPKEKKKLVAGSHFYDPSDRNYCVAYYSKNKGASWSDPIIMPGLSPDSTYSDPVLAYAPDGSRVYFAYMDMKYILDIVNLTFTIDLDIVVSYSDDDGKTWTGPIVALDGLPSIQDLSTGIWTWGFDYDKCWIGTHIDDSQSNWVYVTATRFDNFFPWDAHIAFARSNDQGESWGSPILLDSTIGDMVVQGSRPSGGVGGDVIVAWYHSGTDGWLTGSFEIRTAYSSNNGATFGAPVTAVVDNYEAPFYLGPDIAYHRWWGTMFPDVEVDPGGEAHIIYTHDPNPDSASPEDGDIRYITSSGSPYNSWSAPVTINDDGTERAQGYAALETQHGGNSSTLHAIWEDHRNSDTDNLFFDMYYSRRVPGGGTGWRSNFIISDGTSINDWIFIGDYNDLTANQTTLFSVWTDRRHQTDILAFEDNVYGSLIIAGGGMGN